MRVAPDQLSGRRWERLKGKVSFTTTEEEGTIFRTWYPLGFP